MSALGQKQTFAPQKAMSALPPWHWSAPSAAFLALQVWSLDAQDRSQPAIRLSRKNWLFRADRAVLCPVRGAGCASGSCPAGLLRWGGASVIDALDLCQELWLSVEKTEAKERRFSRWGVAALPLSVFVGVVLGAGVGAAVANTGIGVGVAIGAGFGVGVGVCVTVAVFVFRSSE